MPIKRGAVNQTNITGKHLKTLEEVEESWSDSGKYGKSREQTQGINSVNDKKIILGSARLTDAEFQFSSELGVTEAHS